ncbi:ABC transporter permease [Arthrobacter sp. PAMC25564]|uniref:ABC transporter permease n=1 Tax=Arthrobacter sp. PAMC25564 TaxID=2565366 RepID=UPI0010A2613D|nr:ABC transporter permease [Arthrobacter sp. PAMC25564]QCB97866.1 ABC transporter permease [Arthrobacter sp. PAMC25564]
MTTATLNATRGPGLLAAAGRKLREVPPAPAVAAAVVLFFAIAALAPQLLTARDPLVIDLANSLQPPSLAHPFGTDQSGRDLFTRVIYGSRESLLIGLGATVLATAVALILGAAAGLGGRLSDGLISRGLEVLFAFPVLLLAMLFVTIYGPSVTTQIIAVGLGTAPGYARMIRGQVLSVRNSGYVEAAHALGHSRWTVLRRHVFPNAMRPLVAVITLGIGQSIVWASGLAFLGLGVAPPSPEWGALLDAGRMFITRAWWLEVMPGLAIVAIALAATSLGQFIQKKLEGAPS